MHWKLAALTAALLVCTTARADNWTQFRGPTGEGLSAAQGLPTKWSDSENVAWKVAVPGKGWSSPILYNGRLYLTTAIPATEGDRSGPQSLHVLCLDAETGETVWDSDVFEQEGGQKIHGKNSHASPTPVTDGQRIYVHFGTNGTAALGLDGKVLWTNRELKYAPVHGTGPSPVLVDDLLVVNCDGSDVQFVVGMEQKTGKIRWKTPRSVEVTKGFAFASPHVIELGGRHVVISPGPSAAMAYDPKTGEEIWKVQYPGGYSLIPKPVYGHGLLFVCTGFDSPSLLAIKPDGKGDVTESHVAWKLSKGAPHTPSPLLVGDRLYIVSDAGIATCLNPLTGDKIWQERLGGNFSASPVYADGLIYFQSEQGETIVVKEGEKFEEVARSLLPERTLASYAIGDGAIFLRTEGHLYRIQAK